MQFKRVRCPSKEITWPGGGHSIYFRDSAGNSIELATAKTWNLQNISPDRERTKSG